MLAVVGSLSRIDVHRGSESSSPLDELPISPTSADDLVEAIDDHTRRLLQRHPLARRSRILPPSPRFG